MLQKQFDDTSIPPGSFCSLAGVEVNISQHLISIRS